MWEFNDIRLFQERDIYLVPFCLLVLMLVANRIRRKYRNEVIGKYFIPAILLRFFFVIAYALVNAFYYGAGDTILYFRAVTDMRNALGNDPSLWTEIFMKLKLDESGPLYSYFIYGTGAYTNLHMLNLSNYMVPRFALPFSFMFSNSYLCISFCLSLYSFGGCWRIFRMFTEMYPQLHKKFAVAILFLPSVLFFGGSLLKDSVCLGSLGFGLYALYNIFFKKRKILISAIIVVLTGFLLLYTKPYIVLCLVPTFLLWMFIGLRKKIQEKNLRVFAGVIFGVISIALSFFALQTITKSEIAAQYSSEKILETVQNVQGSFSAPDEGTSSNFSVGTSTVNSTFTLLLLFPLGVVATLFRPFLWEVSNPLILLSALEAFGFLYLTFISFRRIGFGRFFSIIWSDAAAVFCLAYSILFAGIIGVTTTNFGALVRYKIPCVPFFLILLFIVMHKSGKFSPTIIFHKKLF
jgi:hypothetical protein